MASPSIAIEGLSGVLVWLSIAIERLSGVLVWLPIAIEGLSDVLVSLPIAIERLSDDFVSLSRSLARRVHSTFRYEALISLSMISAVSRSVARLLLRTVSTTA